MPKAEGLEISFLSESHIKTDLLETFQFDSANQLIETTTLEFSAVCPFSGLPDVAAVEIVYRPIGGKCMELKSLKYYFTSFRNVGIYQEGVTKRIYKDLRKLLFGAFDAPPLVVKTTYNTRGGFDTICTEGEL